MAERIIESFQRDEEDQWVATLACGHTQHVRHRPPFEVREWVTTQEGRDQRIGQSLDCLFCNMPSLPEGLTMARTTPSWDENTMPAALGKAHTTRADTWGQIIVEEGKLLYEILDADENVSGSWVLRPGVPGIIAPAQPHRVRPLPPTTFALTFWR